MQTLSNFYKDIFGCKAYKISLDAGCTCPNRDGTKGRGGCIFCSATGSGDFAAKGATIAEQADKAKRLVQKKLLGRSGNRKGVYVAYFQNFSSTYGDEKLLLQKYKDALSVPEVKGLCIATRPDCLSDSMILSLAELSKNTFVQIELGLQTSNENTGVKINRCYTNCDYTDAVARLHSASRKIHIVTHVIFGLPDETEEDMLNTVRFVSGTNSYSEPWGIKITSLYVLKGTPLEKIYREGNVALLERNEYFSLLKAALPLLPQNCIVHRLTGDPPKSFLLAPDWTLDKRRMQNEVRRFF